MSSMVFNFGGGGTTELNFEIVGGTTQPSNPGTNTIWINTNTTISEWIFSLSQPDNPSLGTVWIDVGLNSAAPFNALKKRGTLMVYPTGAAQYVSDHWEDKVAMTYDGSEWLSWYTYLYNLGDECLDLTGGWQSGGQATASAGWSAGSTITKNVDSITVYTPSVSGRALNTTNKVDLTNYNKLGMTVSAETGLEQDSSGPGAYLYVRTINSGDWNPTGSLNPPGGVVASQVFSEAGTVELDISGLSGQYYVGMSLVGYVAKSVAISSVYLRR